MALLLLSLVVAWALGAAWLVAVRHDSRPRPAQVDAVVVLGGSPSRLPLGMELVREGYAPLLVVSLGGRPPTPLERRVCAGGTDLPVLCFDPSPQTTAGEARAIEELAQQHTLRRIAVVTSHFHVFRARLLIARSYSGELTMVGAREPPWKLPWYALSESAKLLGQMTIARRR